MPYANQIFADIFEDSHDFGLTDKMGRKVGALVYVQRDGLDVTVRVQATRDGMSFGIWQQGRVVGQHNNLNIKVRVRKEISRRTKQMRWRYQAQFGQPPNTKETP